MVLETRDHDTLVRVTSRHSWRRRSYWFAAGCSPTWFALLLWWYNHVYIHLECLFSSEKPYITFCYGIFIKFLKDVFKSIYPRQVVADVANNGLVQSKQKSMFSLGLIKTCERLCFRFRLMINLPKSITKTNLINEFGSTADPSSWKWPRYVSCCLGCIETPCNQALYIGLALALSCPVPARNSPELSKLCPLSWGQACMHCRLQQITDNSINVQLNAAINVFLLN